MRGLLLDVINQKASEVEVSSDLHEWYKLLNCDIVEMPERTIGHKRYTIICDEEGLLKSEPVISAINSLGDIVFVGNLLIVNTDYDNFDVTSLSPDDIPYIQNHIKELFVRNTKTGEVKKQLILTNVEY